MNCVSYDMSFQVLGLLSHYNSDYQIGGHRPGSSHSEVEEYPTENKPGTRIS